MTWLTSLRILRTVQTRASCRHNSAEGFYWMWDSRKLRPIESLAPFVTTATHALECQLELLVESYKTLIELTRSGQLVFYVRQRRVSEWDAHIMISTIPGQH